MGGLSKMIKEGNAAAHGDDIEFNSTMVVPLFKFTNKIHLNMFTFFLLKWPELDVKWTC